MSNAVSDISSIVEQLCTRVQQLESRVATLEGGSQKQQPARTFPTAQVPRERPPETWQGFPSIELPAAISTVGKAVLGMAGAYIFRALAESGTVPKLPVLVLAIVYAALWMVYATRVHEKVFASLTYASTSLLIISPMLWETTIRFQFLSAASAGTILAGFFAFTLVLKWKCGLEAIPWLTAAAVTSTALALLIETRNTVPLTVAILAAAVMMEANACFGHVLSSRIVPALAADFSVWLVVFLMSSEPIPEGYTRVSSGMIITLWFVLLAIYAGSVAVRGFWLRRKITLVDMTQGTLAFSVAGFGATRASTHMIPAVLGLIMLALAAGCYWGALSRFAEPSFSRNRRIFSVWAMALLVAGSVFLLPRNACVLFLCAIAVAISILYRTRGNIGLGLQPSALLTATVVLSAVPQFIWGAMVGTLPSAPSWAVFVTTAAALLCYAIGSSVEEVRIARRTLWVFPAGVVALAAAALAVTAIGWLATGHWDLSASRLSAVRSIVICVLAVTLAFLGLHWRRIELGWVAYAAVAFGALKLLFEDLPSGSSSTLVFSFLFYGVVLIVLPRLTRRGQTDYLHPRKYFVFSA